MKKISNPQLLTFVSLLTLSLAVSLANATPNTPGQIQMDEINHKTEYKIARDDCATQLGITLPPSPHVNQQLDASQRSQMAACMKQKGFKPRASATPNK